jgi:putative membrane protein
MEDKESTPSAGTGQKGSLADYLAAERTLLAWVRTGLSLMGFGFVVARFGLFLQQLQIMQRVPAGQHYGLSLWFGTALIATGVIVNIFAGWHHLLLISQLDRGLPSQPHPATLAIATAFFLALVGLAMAIYLVTVGNSTRPQVESSRGALHSDLRMTIRYAHLGQDHLDAAASRLDGVLTLPAQTDDEKQA